VADLSQDQIGTSRDGTAEVTLISSGSDSEIFGQMKTQVVVRKFPFSHPYAHLDRHLSLKKMQHTANLKRKTRSSSGELSDGLSYERSPRRARHEVPISPMPSYPQAGLFK
jgi:hypothetical protein